MAAVTRILPGLAAQLAEAREQLRAMLGDVYQAAALPGPTRRETAGPLPGRHWDTGVQVCNQYEATPVTAICLIDQDPGMPLVALRGTDCAFPTDIRTITAPEARRLAGALTAAANAAEGIGGDA